MRVARLAALELRQRKRVLKIGKATGYRRGEHSNGINEVADASKIFGRRCGEG